MERQISIDEVKTCLSGASFPCSKPDLVHYCEQHDGSPELIEALQGVQDENFQTMDELCSEIEAKPGDLDEPFDYYTVWSGYQ